MFRCLACGGELRFDVVSQKMKCDSCRALFTIDEMQKKLIEGTESAGYAEEGLSQAEKFKHQQKLEDNMEVNGIENLGKAPEKDNQDSSEKEKYSQAEEYMQGSLFQKEQGSEEGELNFSSFMDSVEDNLDELEEAQEKLEEAREKEAEIQKEKAYTSKFAKTLYSQDYSDTDYHSDNKMDECGDSFDSAKDGEDLSSLKRVEYSEFASRKTMKVTVFRCPQCGGEIYSNDDTAAGFCSYCGASTVLESRVTDINQPDLIIPFKISKEAALAAVQKEASRSIYSPRDIRAPKNLNQVRGIYMPYWIYDLDESRNFTYKAKYVIGKGDDSEVKTFRCVNSRKCTLEGLAFDGSYDFSDDLSRGIEPYDTNYMKEFSPLYLSGFYADVADVSPDTYRPDAAALMKKLVLQSVKDNVELSSYGNASLVKESEVEAKIFPKVNKIRRAVFPVWFMVFRTKDRVAYGAVNGATGKVALDLPISIGKFITGTAIFTAIIFAFLSTFLKPRPGLLLFITALISLYEMSSNNEEIRQICTRINGKFAAGRRMESFIAEYKRKRRNEILNMIFANMVLVLYVLFNITLGDMKLVSKVFLVLTDVDYFMLIMLIMLIIGCIFYILGLRNFAKCDELKGLPCSTLNLISLILLFLVSLLAPQDKMMVSGAVIISLLSILILQFDTIAKYNILTTQPLPQFTTHIGDHDYE